MVKVSIIVPYLKGPAYLEECIQSIEDQQCEDRECEYSYEIILVDDKDGHDVPKTILKKKQVVHIRLSDEIEEWRLTEPISSEEDESDIWEDTEDEEVAEEDEGSEETTKLMPFGVATARNTGIQKATGKYIFFLDVDDYLLEGALTRLIRLAEEKDALLVTGNKASIWFRPSSFAWEKASRETEVEGIQPLEGNALEERFNVNFSAQGLLVRRDFILEHGLFFDRDNTFYSDAPFVVGALAKSEGRAWIDGDSYYIWRHRNDSVHLPALCQKKRKRRGAEFMNSYEAALTHIQPEQMVLRRTLDVYLCAFTINKFPERIKGETAHRYTTHLNQFIDKSILNEFTFANRQILKLLMKRKYRIAKHIVKIQRALRKKRGLLGKPIQYYRFIDSLIFRRLPIKENWVLIESFYGKGYSDSPKYLYEHLLETRGEQYRYIWCLNSKSKMMKGNPTRVRRFSLRYVYYTTRCKYQIYNTRQPQWLKKRKGMVFLETWHGTPLKKLVFDLDDIHAVSQNHKIMFRKQSRAWDYLISANPFSTDVFERAFDYPRERIIEYGYPRNDLLYSDDKEKIAEEVREELSIPQGKKVILYAPTWRDNQFYGKGQYKFSLAMDLERMKAEFSEDYVLLLRTHYYIADQINLAGLEDFVINGSKYEDVSRLYLVSDLCITDYSSVFFDYANLKRPILFYVYDYEDYKDEIRGLYIDMEKDLPGPIVRTNDELVETLKCLDEVNQKYKKRYEEFTDCFCCVDDGKACERTIDRVFGSMR